MSISFLLSHLTYAALNRYICEKLYEKAISSKCLDDLIHATNVQQKYKVFGGKLINSYSNHAKSLILELMHENNVKQQLGLISY